MQNIDLENWIMHRKISETHIMNLGHIFIFQDTSRFRINFFVLVVSVMMMIMMTMVMIYDDDDDFALRI